MKTKIGLDLSVDNMEEILSAACKHGHKDKVVDILKNGKGKLKCGRLPLLHVALANGHFDVVRILIEEGVDVNERDNKGQTALHIVTKSKSIEKIEIIKLLIMQHDVDVNVKDTSGNTALDAALKMKDDDTVLLLLEDGKAKGNARLIHNVAKLNGSRSLKFLFDDNSQDVKIKDPEGRSLVHSAVKDGCMATVHLVLKHCPDLVNETDSKMRRPIHEAAARGNLEILSLLIENGVDINANCSEGSLLCLAAYHGHTTLVTHLLGLPDIDVNLRNAENESAIQLAILAGQLQCAVLLLEQSNCNLSHVNGKQQTILHYIAQYGIVVGWENVADRLLQKGAEVMAQDIDGQTTLHTAINAHNTHITNYFIKYLASDTETLIKALSARDKEHWTPFRRLIVRMPGIAKNMLDACISSSHDLETNYPTLAFDLQLLDDTFTDLDEDGKVQKNAKPYDTNYSEMKEKHPLNIIAKQKRHELLAHPVLKLVLRRKWGFASASYFFFISFYAALVIALSVYMITADPPFQVNQTWCELDLLDDIVLNLWNKEGQGYLQTALTATVIILACIGIILEIFQFAMTGKERFKDIHNILDWFTYISAFLIIVDFTKCSSRENWQWQLGVACIFLSWMNLLFYLRKAPKVGIYIVMIGMICSTFLHFFTVFFLFILAFAITFYLLLQNQYAFRNIFYSLIKTWVMMIGEMDFTDIFHSNQADMSHEVQVYFQESTYAVYVVFLILVSLIIMNLLTGLAVSDVNKLLEDSGYQMIAMQIQLALDIEFATPVWYHRKITRKKEILGIDIRTFQSVRKALSHFFYGPLSIDIIKAEGQVLANKRKNSGQTSTQKNGDQTMEDINKNLENIMDMLSTLTQKVEALEGKKKGK